MTNLFPAGRLTAAAILALPLTTLAGAAPSAVNTIPRASSAIVVDGNLDDASWANAWTKELAYEVRPGENVAPPVRTEVLVTYDDQAVYFAFRAFDPDPAAIRAHVSDRDDLSADDWVGVVLDTFNDQRRDVVLIVNPVGVQFDSLETAAGQIEWDAIWDSASRIHDWGYAVEMRVPFSSLRFQRADGPQEWGFDAVRSYPRDVRHKIGLFARDRSNNCYLCQAVKIQGFAGADPGRNLEIVPTVTGYSEAVRDDFPHGDLGGRGTETDAGVTVRWGVTPDMTLLGTVNPDFSQVEADALQLDVNEPFALFFPEKRPFFMEGSDFFATPLDVVYTRTMRDPSWGAKLTGKVGSDTVGAYAVRDDITNLLIPGVHTSAATTLDTSNTVSVLRYKRDIGDTATLGVLGTDREGGAYFNRVAGVDGDLRFTATDRVRFQVLASATRYPGAVAEAFGQSGGELRDWAGQASYSHSTRHVEAWAEVGRIGTEFRADSGFLPQVGYTEAEAGFTYAWIPQGKTWFSALEATGEIRETRLVDGGLLSRTATGLVEYEGPLQSHAYVQLKDLSEVYGGITFRGSEIVLHNCMWPADGTHFYVNATYGDRVDYANTRQGRRLRLAPGFFLQAGRHVAVGIDAAWERMRELDQRLYTATIAQLYATYNFSVRSFLRGLVQLTDTEYNLALYSDGRDARSRTLFTQVLFSYKLNPQTVLFLGATSGSQATSEYALTTARRSVFAKVGYAWVR